MKLPFGLPTVSRDDEALFLEWRVWKRTFLEAQIALETFPTASDLVGAVLVDEVESFLEEE